MQKLLLYIVKSLYFCGFLMYIWHDYIFNIMNKGKVKFFNETKGFGFIKDEETGKEYFVHVSGLVDKIQENDEVTYELTEGRKGLNAINVKLA